MTYTLLHLKEEYDLNRPMDFIFFWGHHQKTDIITKSCLSQWYDCTFQEEGQTYHTAEQYMMAKKALLFDDHAIYHAILEEHHPKNYKQLGRQIKNFSQPVWDREKYQIVLQGNLAKFSQNPKLDAFLQSTKGKILVEASPYDTIWGIGLKSDAKDIQNPHTWKGENLLGFALMETRDS